MWLQKPVHQQKIKRIWYIQRTSTWPCRKGHFSTFCNTDVHTRWKETVSNIRCRTFIHSYREERLLEAGRRWTGIEWQFHWGRCGELWRWMVKTVNPSSRICLTNQNWMLSIDRNGKFYVMDFFFKSQFKQKSSHNEEGTEPYERCLENDALTDWPWTTKPESESIPRFPT